MCILSNTHFKPKGSLNKIERTILRNFYLDHIYDTIQTDRSLARFELLMTVDLIGLRQRLDQAVEAAAKEGKTLSKKKLKLLETDTIATAFADPNQKFDVLCANGALKDGTYQDYDNLISNA